MKVSGGEALFAVGSSLELHNTRKSTDVVKITAIIGAQLALHRGYLFFVILPAVIKGTVAYCPIP